MQVYGRLNYNMPSFLAQYIAGAHRAGGSMPTAVVTVCIIHCSHDHSHQIHSLSIVYYVGMDIQTYSYVSSSPPGFNQTAAKQHHIRACRWGPQPQAHTSSIAHLQILDCEKIKIKKTSVKQCIYNIRYRLHHFRCMALPD